MSEPTKKPDTSEPSQGISGRGMQRLSSEAQPPPPSGGIPVYRTSRWLRVLLRLLVYPWMLLDLGIQALIQKLWPPPYRIEGHCKKRGNCCHYILMEWDTWMEKIPWLGRLWLWWYTQIHGFYPRGFEVENVDGRVARVMGCRHLQPDGKCAEYLWRPAICRQWPRITYTSQPYLLKGCGYLAVPRHNAPEAQDHTLLSQEQDFTQSEVSAPATNQETLSSREAADSPLPERRERNTPAVPQSKAFGEVESTAEDKARQEAMQRVQQKLGLKENVQEREE